MLNQCSAIPCLVSFAEGFDFICEAFLNSVIMALRKVTGSCVTIACLLQSGRGTIAPTVLVAACGLGVSAFALCNASLWRGLGLLRLGLGFLRLCDQGFVLLDTFDRDRELLALLLRCREARLGPLEP